LNAKEQVPGSIQIFANALNVSEKELFKMMEQGTIVSSEVLPKVAKEFAKAARSGGALAEALNTVRVQQGRFLTDTQKAQNTIFTNGFGEGLASAYKTLSQVLKDLEPVLKGIGQGFGFLFRTLAAGINMITAPLRSIKLLTDLLIDLDEVSNTFAENTVPRMVAAGALLLTAWGRVLAKFLAVKAVLEELVALSSKNIVGQVERDIGRDIGFDLGVGESTRSGDNPSLNKEATSFDNYLQFYNSEDRFSAMDWLKDNVLNSMGSEIVINQQPTIDEYGSVHIENTVQRSIVNGQAQR